MLHLQPGHRSAHPVRILDLELGTDLRITNTLFSFPPSCGTVRTNRIIALRIEFHQCPGNVVITKLKGFHLVSREPQKKDAKKKTLNFSEKFNYKVFNRGYRKRKFMAYYMIKENVSRKRKESQPPPPLHLY